MNNIYLLAVVLLIAALLGLGLRVNQGLIKRAKKHPNFSVDFNKFGNLGSLGTLIQFSTEYCSNCPASKTILREISVTNPAIKFIEIDAQENFELAKKLSVLATPTVLILDEAGDEIARFSGKPKKDKLVNFINEKLTASTSERKIA